jgi:hypothetical protein
MGGLLSCSAKHFKETPSPIEREDMTKPDLEAKVKSLRGVLRDLIPTHHPDTNFDPMRSGLIPGWLLVKIMARAKKEAVRSEWPLF